MAAKDSRPADVPAAGAREGVMGHRLLDLYREWQRDGRPTRPDTTKAPAA